MTDDKESSSKNSGSNEFDTIKKIYSDKNVNKNILSKNSIYKTASKNKKDYTEYEINCLSYRDVREMDKRTFYQFYKSLIKQKHFLIFSFNPNDYDPYIIKISLFLFSIALYLFINALFFNDNKMHIIYTDEGNFKLKSNLPQIIYSYIIISIIYIFLPKMFLIKQNILEIKKEKNKCNIKSRILMFLRVVIIKFVSFFTLSIIFLFIFWFYLSCFFFVFKNTQSYLIKISLIISEFLY